ncbi:peroxisome proliferator-activated receptor gamma coactivator-related protein 1 [Syngnathus scovelli]|uniref:peroxisome proliferator-activated receptor gamma coactivator-related protein 1 n=1 Tax=Syngnathus scovelli TaxID=161590 RepID=UPI00210FE452|nr:peroxisome proliferator-activated receptor gamma coactivator-related protein 1 [Syngnathus scovelli]
MWSSKMAAQWRPVDVALKAGNVDFLSTRSPCQIGPFGGNMGGADIDTQSCMEHSIMAIFEDSTVSSEDTRQAEEESETLLSALTQMLECVEDDVSCTLSPFDTLPDTKLLNCQEFDNSISTDKITFSAKLRPRAKTDAGKEDKSKVARLQPAFRQQSQTFLQGPKKKTDPEVNVFTSSSLVNLVKLMHPYCLKMHVEEERRDHQSRTGPSQLETKHTMLSQGEVWKYEKPTGDSDEDINVVSDNDDDTTLKEIEENNGGIAKDDSGKLLKSTLLNGNSSRDLLPKAKKRVSFGPIQVISFDQSVDADISEETLPSVASATEGPAGPMLVTATTASVSLDDNDKAEDPPSKRKVKAKSLSLQEYRLLRQKRQPLAEKMRSNTTKWPSVPQPPKELIPIICSHGQRQNLCETKSSPHHIEKSTLDMCPPQRATYKTSRRHHPKPVEKKPLFAARHHGLKSLQSKSKHTSLDGLKSKDEHTVKEAASQKSPLKNPTTFSTDPPNPVIIRLPVSQMPTLSNCHPSAVFAASQIAPSTVEPHPNREVDDQVLTRPQTKPSSKCRKPQNLMLTPVTCPTRRSLPEQPSPPSAAAESGIEACDLTSLLEQFEEKQAEESDPANFSNAFPSSLHEDTERTTALIQTSAKEHEPLRTLHSVRPKSTIDYLEDPKNVEHVTPETLGTEVIVDTQGIVSTMRRKIPPSKGIQIIDPRPLPSRKTNASELAASPYICSSVSADHDYCVPVDYSKAPPSLKNTREVEETASSVKCKQASIGKCDSPIRADEKYQLASSSGTISAPSCTPLTPPPSPPSRGREKSRYSRRPRLSESFRSSSSSSSSASRSPKRRRSHHKRSGSRSWSSSPSHSVSRSPPRQRKQSCTLSRCNRSRSRSWSRSRSPSPSSPTFPPRRSNVYRESWKVKMEHQARLQKLKAIDERRVVYVGRIRRSMTHDELRERFSHFGEVECVSLHFREKGDHYGFVTFYHMDDAFAAIDNGGKLRRADELPFDICFGGRRQFCNSDYADLDAKVDAEPSPAKSRFQEIDFDSLLKQAQRGLR